METTGIPNFRTQILIRSKKQKEDPAILFRKIQKVLWEWIGRELPGKNREGKAFADLYPFETWRRLQRWQYARGMRRGPTLGFAECRYLETARLMAQSIAIYATKESTNAPGFYDHSEDSVVAIESAKNDPDFTGVRLSFETATSFQPFAGFFPLPKPNFHVPSPVQEILSGDDWTCEFFPVIESREELKLAELYPLSGSPIVIDNPEEEASFLRQLRDRFRPICFVVCFGAGRRMRRFAERLAGFARVNALVFILDERAVRPEEIDKIVPGLHARKEFAAGGVRVFFPFGRYMRDVAANPGYRLPLFGTKQVEAAILTGLLRYFDIDENGWRRTPRDIHMTELSLHETRREDFGKGERGKVNTLQKLLSESLELRKKENASHQKREEDLELHVMECEDRIKELEKELAERDELLSEANASIATAVGENAKLRGKSGISPSGSKTRGMVSSNRCISLENIPELFTGEVREFILEFLESQKGSLSRDYRPRQAEVIETVLQVNPQTGCLRERRDRIKKIFDGISRMGPEQFQQLKELGIELVAENTHYRVQYGDYKDTIPKTPSDWRSFLNTASQMAKKFF